MFEHRPGRVRPRGRTGERRCFYRLSPMWTTGVNTTQSLYSRGFQAIVMKTKGFSCAISVRPATGYRRCFRPAIADV
jgi:hypothetical protein